MDFERGIGTKESLGIGTIANAIEIVNIEYTDRSGGLGTYWVKVLGTEQIFEYLNILSNPDIAIGSRKHLINEFEFYGRTPGHFKIWNLLGKFVKYRNHLYLIKEDLL